MPTPLYLEDGIELAALPQLPGGQAFVGALVASGGQGYLADKTALDNPPDIFSSDAPGTTLGVRNQKYYYKRTSSLTDLYVHNDTTWVKQFSFSAEGDVVALQFNTQGQASYTFTGQSAGTYALPANGTDLVGITNPRYYRDGAPVSGMAQFAAGNTLTATATTSTGGQATLRQQ